MTLTLCYCFLLQESLEGSIWKVTYPPPTLIILLSLQWCVVVALFIVVVCGGHLCVKRRIRRRRTKTCTLGAKASLCELTTRIIPSD